MEWHELGGKYKTVTNCKYLTIKNSRAQCKLKKGIIKKQVAGEIFYLGGK